MQTHQIINNFDKYLQDTLGATKNTRRKYILYVKQFLKERFPTISQDELPNIKPSDLMQFILNQRNHYKVPSLKAMSTALRSFFKYLQMKGFCDEKLVNAIPTVPGWKYSRLPKYLMKQQVEKFLASFKCTRAGGLRDYAIALCMVKLGLRRGEVANLTLDDINWRSGTVRIAAGKLRRADKLPLPKDVGKAIVDYLRNGRPHTEQRQIFVRHHPPVGELLKESAVGAAIRRGFKRSGLNIPSNGTPILRHTVATHMVQNGVSIKEVADILRHRDIDSTVIYAKVNLPMLFEVALPWPKEGGIS